MDVELSKGFAAAEGLEVELVTAKGGDGAGALVLSGKADFALAGPEVAIYIYNGESADKPLIFCALTATDGFYLVSRTKLDNFDWSMLNNRKVIGWRPGSTPELYLQYVMKQRGVDAATIGNVVTNIGVPARDGAWISGAGDFGIFMEPNLSKLEKAGEAHVITSIGKEVGRADYTVFFAKRSWLEKNAATAQKWTNAVAQAQAWVATASAQAIAAALAAVAIRDVPLNYFSPERETLALSNVSLEIAQGEFVAIVGSSGCGKSALLSLISGLIRPSRGSIQIAGKDVNGPSPHAGYMFQKDTLLECRTVLDNVLLGPELLGLDRQQARSRAADLLIRYGLGEFVYSLPSQ